MSTITHAVVRTPAIQVPVRGKGSQKLVVGDVVGGKGTGLGARVVLDPETGALAYPRTMQPAPELLSAYTVAGKVTVTGHARARKAPAKATPKASSRKASSRKAQPKATAKPSVDKDALAQALAVIATALQAL